MTAKEKAQQLYNKYKETLNIQNDMRPGANPFAKACALIVADAVIKENAIMQINVSNDEYHCARIDWWNEVKKELEAL